ncbi:MAG: hypothetical protein BAA04_00440 [Firmicutes bacterium ZCTH02-B6]|nr:MAG: hypothetical protein BAA04_00440 [Firmicutes bacterium ZCTH02-B6]
MDVGARTHVGKVRRNNEDGYLVRDGLLAVADGMGGHRAGEVASGTVLAVLRDYPFGAGEPAAELEQAMRAAHAKVRQLATEDASMAGMGTTLTVALVCPGRVHVGHVGDSRLYLWRQGQLRQMTADHSVAAELLRAGQIDEEAARVHPHRHVLTRAIGAVPELEIDLLEFPLEAGDGLLLCTDGLSSLLDEDDMLRVLVEHSTAQAAADALVQLALARGGIDNVTVVVARPD